MNTNKILTLICRIVIFIISVLISHQSSAQIPDTSWTSHFKMEGYVYKISTTNDSGYILVGAGKSVDGDSTGYHGNYDDIWVLKLNATGHKEWYKMYGGSDIEYVSSVQQTKDGGYIVSGETQSVDGDVHGNHGNVDCWVLKLNKSGDTVWTKTFGGTKYESATSIKQTFDGGYIMSGFSGSGDGDVGGNQGSYDYWIVKLDSIGTISWSKFYGGKSTDIGASVIQTKDSCYVLGGYSRSINGDVFGNHGENDYWVLKLNEVGDTIWTRTLGGSGTDNFRSLSQTTDGGYVVAGSSSSTNGDITDNHGSNDYWVVKLNEDGKLLWSKSFGGSGNENLNEIQATVEGGSIIAGSTNSTNGDVVGYHGSTDQWLVKLNVDGTIEWTRAFGGTKGDGANSIRQTIDGGYVVAGTSVSNDGDFPAYNPGGLWIVKFASSTAQCTWLGSIDNNWETPGNWSCGKVPDANSDVIISGGTVIVHADATCRSLKLAPAASLTVQPGVHLNILH